MSCIKNFLWRESTYPYTVWSLISLIHIKKILNLPTLIAEMAVIERFNRDGCQNRSNLWEKALLKLYCLLGPFEMHDYWRWKLDSVIRQWNQLLIQQMSCKNSTATILHYGFLLPCQTKNDNDNEWWFFDSFMTIRRHVRHNWFLAP